MTSTASRGEFMILTIASTRSGSMRFIAKLASERRTPRAPSTATASSANLIVPPVCRSQGMVADCA